MTKRLISVLLAIICCLTLLGGCGENEQQIPEQDAKQLSESPAEDIQPQQGGSISIFTTKPDTLCPIRTHNENTAYMLNLVFDSLITPSADMTPTPNLALSWSVSSNGLNWNIKLRNDVMWHDGTPFTASDVVYTINQIRTEKDGYYTKNLEEVSKATAVNQYEVKIQLKNPNANFINGLYFPIIKSQKTAVDKDSFAVIGTGAFTFEDRGEVTSYYLNRNENYWKTPSYLDTVQVKIVSDKDTALYSFSSGEIDLLCVDPESLGSKADISNAGLITYPTNKFSFLGFNHGNSLLKHQEVRQAFAFLINRQELVDEVLPERARPAFTPIDSSWSLYDPETPAVKGDAEKARQILEENGWDNLEGIYQKQENGKTLRLEFELLVNDSNAIRVQAAYFLANKLREAGISLQVVQVSFEEYNQRINRKNYDMFLGTFALSDDLDFRFMLEKGNIFAYNNETMNQLLNDTQKAVTAEEVQGKYMEFQKLFCEDAPIIGLYFENNTMIYNKRLQGTFAPNQHNVYYGLENLFLQQ